MHGRRAVPVGTVLQAGTVVLLGTVLLVRPGTAVEPVGPQDVGRAAGRPPAAAPRSPDPAEEVVLRREGTAGLHLGDAVERLPEQGWRLAPAAGDGCTEVVAGTEPPGAPRIRGWAVEGRVVAVRLEAPTTPGVLLPTAVRTGWSLEAVAGGSRGVLVPAVVRDADGAEVTVLVGDLPVGSWPPDPGPARGHVAAGPGRASGAAVAAEPPLPGVELVLGDAGTGQIVTAEVRLADGRGCSG